VNIDTLVELPTASNPLALLNATDVGLTPMANGDPGAGVSDPFEETRYIETLLEP
jgi:hypothetical protein